MPTRLPRAPLMALLLLAVVGCKDDPPAPTATGAWLSRDTALLLRIGEDDTVRFELAAGAGSCVVLAEGTIDREAKVLRSEYGDRLPYTLTDDTLTLEDPRGELGGVFDRVDVTELCFVNVPPLTEEGARITPLTLGTAVSVRGGVGREVAIDVPADAVSFGVYLFGDTAGTKVAFGALEDPAGVEQLVAVPDLQFCTLGHCSVVVPKTPSVSPSPGRWRAIVVASSEEDLEGVSVRGALRPGPLGPTSFTLRPVVTTDLVDVATLTQSLDDVAARYAADHGIHLVVAPIVVASGSQDVVQDFLHPTTASLMATGEPDVVNVFLVRRIIGAGGVLGIASGIPAAFGVTGPFNGLLVDLDFHLDVAGDFFPELFEETVAHEIGHMLGLFHTTESDGAFFDPIADTPQCRPEIYDTDGDGTLHADECIEADGQNRMFWTPSTTTGVAIPQDVLTVDQRYVIERSLGGQ